MLQFILFVFVEIAAECRGDHLHQVSALGVENMTDVCICFYVENGHPQNLLLVRRCNLGVYREIPFSDLNQRTAKQPNPQRPTK